MKKEILRLEGVTLKKNGTVIFQNMSLNIMEGEILGLIPINTYGAEDDLLDVIMNNPPLYYGYVYYQEHCVNSWKHEEHKKNRICLINNETALVKELNVVSNIFPLRAGFGKEIISERMLAGQLVPFMEEIHVQLDPYALAENLTPYQKVIAELLRAVVAGYRLIILKDVSSIITEKELQNLHHIMKYYTQKGFSFLYVSFHLEELQQICDRAAWMSEGLIHLILEREQLAKAANKEIYQGIQENGESEKNKRVRNFTERILEIRDMTGEFLTNFHCEVYYGECLVIQCLDTQVYREFLYFIQEDGGFAKSEIYLRGSRIKGYKSRHLVLLKEEPARTMIFQDFSVKNNLCIALDKKIPSIWFRRRIQKSAVAEYIRIFGENIFEYNLDELTERQKLNLVYMRIMLEGPELVFLVQPFKNADAARRQQIGELQEMLLERGIALVILTMNAADALEQADRLIQVGRTKGTMYMKEYTKNENYKIEIHSEEREEH